MAHLRVALSYRQIFFTFLKLGCIAFGGPAAHLVFFHQVFVKQLQWLSENNYAQLLALAQILPGPSSSQVGIAIGYSLRGHWGAVVAWLGFTLPSALLMTLVAVIGSRLSDVLSQQFFHVIQLIVLAVVLWAFWQMLRSFCQQLWQYFLMLCAAGFVYFVQLPMNQILLIAVAALVGVLCSKYVKPNATVQVGVDSQTTPAEKKSVKHKAAATALGTKQRSYAYIWLILFCLPFFILPILKEGHSNILLESIQGFYYSASAVFGGGHIILPLLHQDFVVTGLVSGEKFDLGYAFAQLMPGPLFSFASYLGALLPLTDSVLFNALIGTVLIFIPSFLLVFGALPYWSYLMHQPRIYQAVAGINAAVVGLLLCLVVQMTQQYILQWTDVVFVLLVIAMLKQKIPIWVSLISSFCIYYALLSFLSGVLG